MDEATLEGCREKVGRAEELLREIDDRWQAFLNTNPYPAWVEANDDTGCHIVWFDFSTRTPLVLPVILGEFARDTNALYTVSEEALVIMGEYDWPGNLRELANCLMRIAALKPGDNVIRPEDLPPRAHWAHVLGQVDKVVTALASAWKRTTLTSGMMAPRLRSSRPAGSPSRPVASWPRKPRAT